MSTVAPAPNVPGTAANSAPLPGDWIPIARYGRYTLVELAPQAAQQNLLLQVVDVSIPGTPPLSVEDGLRHVLQRSGYSLCDDDLNSTPLYGLPLPAAHLRLGPMFLHDVLLTLAGPAWELQVDDRAREVCFTPRLEALP
ncbi:PilL N-terminal domain-containing protein [Parahaliea mediterranea]|uniref:PFGI-1 class ICE element type IV pilus protein PilL2 n=1 Tax=Parahaliea mediterranea TaxID=651086 RepID=UPI00240E8B44|nr:PilL N-terminal domain-containing protein [Parahaliea mediterranea]|tara:strand:- start:1171 stop:1590 length:420 start_codon:yes stop_codon:yes gene_type:complete